jgi:hypothetical protein
MLRGLNFYGKKSLCGPQTTRKALNINSKIRLKFIVLSIFENAFCGHHSVHRPRV